MSLLLLVAQVLDAMVKIQAQLAAQMELTQLHTVT
jgi:hypothetical protein